MTVLFLLLFTLVTTGAGTSVLAGFGLARHFTHGGRFALAFGLGCLLVYVGVATVGPFRLDVTSVGAIAAAAAALALPTWAAWLNRLRSLNALATLAAAIAWCRANPWAAGLWAAVGLSLTSLLIQGMAPPNDYDSLMYHIALPRRDVEQGFIGPDWELSVFSFFPALAEHMYRVALVLSGERAAQCITGLFGVALAVGTSALARRLGLGATAAALAALMTVSVRATVWELATCEVEAVLACYVVALLLIYLHWREQGGFAPMIVFGLLAGASVATKYHGLVVVMGLAPVLLWEAFRRPRALAELAAGAMVALAVLAPHLVRDYVFTGNPVFPLLNHMLFPDGPAFYRDMGQYMGRERSLLNLLRVYWDASVLPTYYFDGAMLGAPYLLAFAPMAVFARPRPTLPLLGLIAIYTVVWYLTMSQQVRFLLPITPLFAIFAAAGAAWLWGNARGAARVATAIGSLGLALPQAAFVGIYSALRLPAALGVVDRTTYLTGTPTMYDNFYLSCRWVEERLRPGERVLSMIMPHSYYCPQAQVVVPPALPGEEDHWLRGRTLPPLDARQLAQALRTHAIRYVMVETSRELRSGPAESARTITRDLSGDRIGALLLPILDKVKPEFTDSQSAVYDGDKLAAILAE
ncbi:MAG TPA: hypothetical protein VL974_04385 [Magnetospirillum sp.]|jgi:hypothetical protein|nr:hypothetical protein [Magnetospirillum sp.]